MTSLKQAAKEYAEKHGNYYPHGAVTTQDCEDAFIAGAEWMEQQLKEGGK